MHPKLRTHDDERAATGEVYGYEKRQGRDEAWDIVQRHEMVGVFQWPTMKHQPGMHPLPAEVKDYFSAATDAAEATPEGNVRNDSESNPNCDDPGNKGQGKKKKLPRNKKGPTRPPRGGS